jgi:hypothetical protein
MQKLLADPTLKERAQNWPATVESAPKTRITGLCSTQRFVVINVHDHGNVWTPTGWSKDMRPCTAMSVRTAVQRISDGPRSSWSAGTQSDPGDIDVVPPGKIHQEHAGPDRSIAFIVRARRPGTYPQHYYNPDTGAVAVNNEPQQIVQTLT